MSHDAITKLLEQAGHGTKRVTLARTMEMLNLADTFPLNQTHGTRLAILRPHHYPTQQQ